MQEKKSGRVVVCVVCILKYACDDLLPPWNPKIGSVAHKWGRKGQSFYDMEAEKKQKEASSKQAFNMARSCLFPFSPSFTSRPLSFSFSKNGPLQFFPHLSLFVSIIPITSHASGESSRSLFQFEDEKRGGNKKGEKQGGNINLFCFPTLHQLVPRVLQTSACLPFLLDAMKRVC